MDAMPVSSAVMDAMTKSSAIMDITQEFLAVLNIAPKATMEVPRILRLVSSLADTSLMSVQAAGISVVVSSLGVSEVLPPSTVLPVTAMAILCVWVSYASSVSPEAAAPDLVLPEAVTSAYELSALSPICELPACPVTSTVVACELPVCLEMTTEVVPKLPVCQDMTTVVIPKLFVCPFMTTEVIPEFLVCLELPVCLDTTMEVIRMFPICLEVPACLI